MILRRARLWGIAFCLLPLVLCFVLSVLRDELLYKGPDTGLPVGSGQRGIEYEDLGKARVWDVGIGLLYGLSFLTVPIAILLLVTAKKMSDSRGPSDVARRFPAGFFWAAAGVSLTLGGICSAYHAAWGASAAKEEGIVESPGPIPIVGFDPPGSFKGEHARVDTLGFIWYNRGQKVTVLFTPVAPKRVDRASIAGDHPLSAMACFSAAIASLFVAVVNGARRIWHPLPAAEVIKRTSSAEESEEYLSAQMERLSQQQRDAIRRLARSGRIVEAIQEVERFLRISLGSSAFIAQKLRE